MIMPWIELSVLADIMASSRSGGVVVWRVN